jgi:hypothetical protein
MSMKQILLPALILSSLVVASCGKKSEEASSDATPPAASSTGSATPAPAADAPQADPSQDEADRAQKQVLLDYATMEDNYINDPHAQWATAGKASSTFGDDSGEPSSSSLASNVVGTVDGKTWTNNHQDVGMDWLEASFAKPVTATEVRVVFANGEGVEAVSKVELQDAQGKWNTVWSGLSDVKRDARGNRTWFVRTFEKTAYPVNAVKITIANNVQRGYKVVDAVQLVGQ